MSAFDTIAARYRETSLVQASAGVKLASLLAITPQADILDVGCGTGNLTAELARMSSGRIVGIDPSGAMIAEADQTFPDPRITFSVMDAEGMKFGQEFDIIYCNSAFQWFCDPGRFLENARKTLRPGGMIGIQAPATEAYCPIFIRAIRDCCSNPAVLTVFKGFRSPWFMLETAEAYRDLFETAGFNVLFCTIEESVSRRTPQEVFDIFSSGARAGYLNRNYFDSSFPEGFENAFLDGIRRSFEIQAATDGKLDLLFHRIFLIAENPAST